ncbi:MAG: serine protease, partial [Verrucomicrobiota bacterium]
VYNTLAPSSGWVTFQNAKLLQSLDDGAIINLTPDADDYACIFLNNPPAVSDYQYFTFTALPVGTYTYVNKNDDDRTIRKYDFGRIVYRDEIPLTVLNGQKAFDLLAANGRPQTDVISTLPDSDNLTASGSGFFISSDGYLITNNHVVKNARRVKVKNADGVYDAQVIRVDETNDLALLKVGGQFNPLTISPDDVALGDSVFTIGFPDIQLQGTHPKYTSGQISGLTGIQDDPNEYQISVPVQPGNSGGPLVDSAGNVKGVIVAHLDDFAALRAVGSLPQNVNYAIKGNILRDFIGAGTEVKLTSFTPDPNQVSPIPKVQKAVATVLVY